MISVPNLLLRLNGNNGFVLLLLLLFIGTSCDLFRPAQTGVGGRDKEEDDLDIISGGRVFNPETGEYEHAGEVVVENMDTIRWRDIPVTSYPPITSEGLSEEIVDRSIGTGNQGTEFKQTYNVSVLLPFMTDRFNPSSTEIYNNSIWAIQFYAGVKLAFEQLESEGVKLNVTVLDTKADDQTLKAILDQNTALASSNLILGGVRKGDVVALADYALRNKIPYVSPYNASGDVTQANPYYIQVNPTLLSHLEAITKHAAENYRPEQVVLVVQNKPEEIARLDYIQQIYRSLAGRSTNTKFEEAVIQDNSANYQNLNINPLLRKGQETVFIVPSWSDPAFVLAFLRKAFIANRYNPITVYGMPQWMELENADYEYYEALNLYVSSASYTDPYAPDTQEFRRKFYQRYGTSPDLEAYRGYDDMLYFGRMLKQHGTKFPLFLDQEPQNMLHTRFRFEPVVDVTQSRTENYRQMDRYENKFVYILGFENYYYQPKN